ncbi:MAG: hypothetical protein MJE63_18600, partial [Proteobacteria bacterium]|nr:hypothetical protein [Pseudomonadota bacterium]
MKSNIRQTRFIILTVLTSVLLLSAGIAGMSVLAGMKTSPTKKPNLETALHVEVMETQMESVIPYITGYGEVKAVDVVDWR